jgi:hypothetical protein
VPRYSFRHTLASAAANVSASPDEGADKGGGREGGRPDTGNPDGGWCEKLLWSLRRARGRMSARAQIISIRIHATRWSGWLLYIIPAGYRSRERGDSSPACS